MSRSLSKSIVTLTSCNETLNISVSLRNMALLSTDRLDDAMSLLAEEMDSKGIAPHDLVVCGGSAILALKISQRTTKDVDILATLDDQGTLVDPRPLSPELLEAAENVGKLLHLPENWLNTGPADQLKAGLPEGFVERLKAVEFGPALRVHYTGRYDLIHLKLFALIDLGPGKHSEDLRSLNPTEDELLKAARWVATQDAGDEFPQLLKLTLRQIGYDDVAEQL
jgi:hypothetical protein